MGRVVAVLALVVATATTAAATVPAAIAAGGHTAAPSATGATRPAGTNPPPVGAPRERAPAPPAASARPAAGPDGPAGPPPPTATTPVAVSYFAPVDVPPVGGFRPPTTPYGPGNRGVDYDTVPGTAVRAAAAGQVAFAGPVGGRLHVVVLHPDGIRTSYSFLASVAVRRGQAVAAGDTVGTAGPALHFGARAGDAYVDPLVLLAGEAGPVVRLIPDDRRAMGSEEEERSFLGRLGGVVRRGAQVGAGAAVWVAEGAVDAAGEAASVAGMSVEELRVWVPAAASTLRAPVRITQRSIEWWLRRDRCTATDLVAPPPPPGRRRVVLVAGLASRSSHDAVDDLDTAALGYADADRVRFSYRGGTIDEQPYDAADTQVDIAESGRLLRRLLERLHAREPEVPIDVVAHSMGGLVARVALGDRAPPGVERLTTLGTPHQGADLATGIALARASQNGEILLRGGSLLADAGVLSIDPMSPAVEQLAETSDFIRGLNRRPLPPALQVTSIAARGDAMVAAPRSHLGGATNVVVDLPELIDHSALPGSDAAQREMALAAAGMYQTCESLPNFLADTFLGEGIGIFEDVTLGAAAWELRRTGRGRQPSPKAPEPGRRAPAPGPRAPDPGSSWPDTRPR